MNLKFNDKSDIDYNDKILVYLKEKNDVAANFFSVVRLYNYLTKNKNYILTFFASQINKNFHAVSWSSEVGKNGYDNFTIQSDDFVPALAKNQKIDILAKNFSYTFKNAKEKGLSFIKICSYPQCVNEFLIKYKKQIDTYSHLGDKVETEEYENYCKLNTEYVNAAYNQDVKKLYYNLENFEFIVNNKFDYHKLAINFERGDSLKVNMITSISFISDKNQETFKWKYPITFRMSNMLAKDGKFLDKKYIDSNSHVLLIENTQQGWIQFDKSILESYYEEFSTICLHSKLNKSLDDKIKSKAFKL